MTSGLAPLIAGIWTEAGYETTISHRDGQTYVLAEHAAAGTYDLLWVLDPGTELTVDGIERYRSRIATLDVEDAYAVTAASLDPQVVERAARHGIEAVGVETLRSLADESGVGQDAVDAALATTVGADADDEGDDTERGPDTVGADPSDPDTQAEIRRRMAVMMGEVDPDDDPETEGDDGERPDDGVVPAAEAGAAAGADGERAADHDASDDADGTEANDTGGGEAETAADETDDDPFGDDDELDSMGSSDLPGDGLPEDPTGSSDDGVDGPLSSRRGLITGGVAAVLSAGVLDFAVFNLFLGSGGGGLPAYNETRVKADAATVPPDAVLAAPDQWTDEPVTYDPAVVETVEKSGGLWSVTFAVEGGRIVGRWDGDEPSVGTPYAVWGVLTGTTTVDGSEVPQMDVVDVTTGGGSEGGGGSGTTTGGTTAAGESTAPGGTTTANGG